MKAKAGGFMRDPNVGPLREGEVAAKPAPGAKPGQQVVPSKWLSPGGTNTFW